MKTLNVGILGAGFIGKVHAYCDRNMPLFYEMPIRTRLTHVCDSVPAAVEKMKDLFGAETGCSDFREVTENPQVDIVHVCTPNTAHLPALLSAMAHNKHIYCSKPMVVDLAEARQIAAALPAYRGTAQMTLQNRFWPAVMRAKQLLEEGRLGQVLEFRGAYLHDGNEDPKTPLKWKLDAAFGGGSIADMAPHILDLMHYLLGDYEELSALTHIAYPERPSAKDPKVMVKVTAEDAVKLLARMKSGATGVLEASKLSTGLEDPIRFEIHGSQGGLRYDCMKPHWLEFYDRTAPGEPIGGLRGWNHINCGQRYPKPPANGFPTPKASIGWMRSHLASLANFYLDVAAGKPGNPGLGQGVYVQQLMECCRVSAGEKRWIRVE